MESNSKNIFDYDLFSPTTKEEFEQFEQELKPHNKANKNAKDVDLTEAVKIISDNFDKFVE